MALVARRCRAGAHTKGLKFLLTLEPTTGLTFWVDTSTGATMLRRPEVGFVPPDQAEG
jgi:hypothetical protein